MLVFECPLAGAAGAFLGWLAGDYVVRRRAASREAAMMALLLREYRKIAALCPTLGRELEAADSKED